MVVNAKSCRLRCCQVYGEPFFCTSHVLVQQTLHSVFAIEGEDDFSQVRKDDFPLPKVLAGALKARKNDIPVKVRLLLLCVCVSILFRCEICEFNLDFVYFVDDMQGT
ncbi:hypothetical protein HanHA300_Chr11g0392811 [Helianthus annuus]|nr:hypothetical protein HanHA300_Chr11g0392811 [Helianthus annuus]KAJ0516616.1 hypothetical protein HanHA89_Chr11g0415801 [Helianthus annuus]KAJ0684619.1 hypothetical protein HanLR1_Chr11g0393191 [Helianthus annuus]